MSLIRLATVLKYWYMNNEYSYDGIDCYCINLAMRESHSLLIISDLTNKTPHKSYCFEDDNLVGLYTKAINHFMADMNITEQDEREIIRIVEKSLKEIR